MALTTSDLAALSRLLDEALALGPAEHDAWLAALPESDRHLEETLRELLAEHAATSQRNLLSTLPKLGDAPVDQPRDGEAIGPYRLIREIGHGGMGSVWLAERADGSLKRQIALKLPRLAWGSGLAERMARERDIAALLEHPNIARLYDAGVDGLGRPYLALEYIDGQPIDVWCIAHEPGVPRRLRLFIQVARAVAYAHGRLVVHRDLKPSNVLVSADGQAHLLDFGIAKLLHEAADGQLTQQQGRLLTPHYASPEQIQGETVTVASDVYSLGVLLYQLLTAQLPYSRKTLGALEQAILEDEPPAASTRVQDKALARQLRGDLDAILAKALKRTPSDRYATADAMAEDLQRYLDGHPVHARPDSTGYRLRKALKRHWIGVGASAAVLVAVLSGAAVAVWQAQRATQAAERERAVKSFVAEVFRVGAQGPAPGSQMRTVPADVFLERSARLVQTRFGGQPALQAEMYGVVGGIFTDMGASRLAADYATRRLDALAAAGAGPRERARSFIELATLLLQEGRLDDAERQARRAIDLAPADGGLQIDARVIVARALVARRERDSAIGVLDDIEARVARRAGGPVIASAWIQGLRARLLANANRRDEALPLYDAAIAKALALEGPRSAAAVEIRLDVTDTLGATMFVDKAQSYFDAAVAALRARGGDHGTRAAFETARFAAKRYVAFRQTTALAALAALVAARAEMSAAGRVLPDEMRARLDAWEASILFWWGDIESALTLAERSLPVLLKLGPSPAERLNYASQYGLLMMDIGRHELADQWLRERLRLRVETGGGAHPYHAFDYILIATNLLMQSRFADALAFLDTAPHFEAIRGEGSPNPDRYNLAVELARSAILLESGDPQQALARFPHSMAVGDRTGGDEEAALSVMGETLCALGRPEEGMRALRVVESSIGRDYYEHNLAVARVRAVAGNCVLQQGNRREAMAWARQARAALTAQPHAAPYFRAPLLKLEAALGIRAQADAGSDAVASAALAPGRPRLPSGVRGESHRH